MSDSWPPKWLCPKCGAESDRFRRVETKVASGKTGKRTAKASWYLCLDCNCQFSGRSRGVLPHYVIPAEGDCDGTD